jgi:hypothetical protein
MFINPYASPNYSGVDEGTLPPKLTLRRASILVPVGVVGGILLGAVTNAVNGAVSPQYFSDVMRWDWDAFPGIWLASIRQGMLEGTADGLGYSLLFVTLTCILTDRRCHLKVAIKYGVIALAVALSFWAIGGACGVAYAAFLPDHCDSRFFGWHDSIGSLLCYAWVRGSIWGIVYGGLPSVVITSIGCVKVSQRLLAERTATQEYNC